MNKDLRHFWRVAWRHKWVLLVVLLAIPGATYAISSSLEKTYESTATLQVSATANVSSVLSEQFSVGVASAGPAARLIETTRVARLAAQELGEPPGSAPELLAAVSAEADEAADSSGSLSFLTITAQAESGQRAADIANAFADAITAERTDSSVQSINRTIDSLEAEAETIPASDQASIDEIAQQLVTLRGLRESQSEATQVIEPAPVPSSPISPKPERNTALALVFSILLTIGLVPLLDRLDRRLRDPEELEPLVGQPLLAMVPSSAFPGQVPTPQVREAFQTLRASLTYFNIDRSLSSVLVTSAGHAEGKTTVATNLAIAFANDGKDVVLVDGDLRKPQAVRRLGVEPSIGLESVLLDDQPLDRALAEVQGIEGGRLRVLPCVTPPPNPSVLLGSKKMESLLSQLAEQADLVVIDTPPILAVSDVIPLLERVSGTVLVAKVNQSTQESVTRAKQVIETARGSILGVVVTGAKGSGLYGYEEYGYGAGYASGSSGGQVATGAGLRGPGNGEVAPSSSRSLADRVLRR